MVSKQKKRRIPKRKKQKKQKLWWQQIKWKKLLLHLGIVFGILGIIRGYQVWAIHQEQAAFEKANKTEFIEIIGNTARDLAAKNDLYASVMVAQAILESDWGESQLTKEANNLFGMKGSYNGDSYEIETQEDDGNGNLYTVVAQFRKYPTYHDSLRDNAALLSGGVSWDAEYYAGAWKSKTNSYKEATAYLQGRYATDTNYAAKLDELIEQYDLTQFDK